MREAPSGAAPRMTTSVRVTFHEEGHKPECVPDKRTRKVFKLYLFDAEKNTHWSRKLCAVYLSCAARTRVMKDCKAHRWDD